MRVPYGFISSRHGYGALAGEFPEFPDSEPVRAVDQIVSMGTISHFSWVEKHQGMPYGMLSAGSDTGRTVRFPINPFLGIMGVARATEDPVPSVPPGTTAATSTSSMSWRVRPCIRPCRSTGPAFSRATRISHKEMARSR